MSFANAHAYVQKNYFTKASRTGYSLSKDNQYIYSHPRAAELIDLPKAVSNVIHER